MMTVNGGKKDDVACFKVLFWNLLVMAEEDHKIPRLGLEFL
jgi:hypothetical protein